MPQFFADREPRIPVKLALRLQSNPSSGAAGRGLASRSVPCSASGRTGAGVVDVMCSGPGTLILEAMELIDVTLASRNQAAPAGQLLCLIEHPALLSLRIGISRARPPLVRCLSARACRRDRPISGRILIDSPRRKAKCRLKLQRHPCIGIADLRQIGCRQFPRLV